MRLAGQAKMGFFPAADEAIDGILKHLKLNDSKPDQVCVLDPCAGEGKAVQRLTEGLGVKSDRVYCVELDKGRMEATRLLMPEAKVLHASYLGTQITGYSMGLIYCNPPYDDELGGGRREELSFLMRATWTLAPGGVIALVIPMPTLKKRDVVNFIDSRFEEVRVFRFPEAVRKYGEVVVFGVKRKVDLPQESISNLGELHKQGLNWGYGGTGVYFAELGHPYARLNSYGERGTVEEELHVYEVRSSYAPHTFKKIAFTDEELQAAIAASPLGRLLRHCEPPPPKRPPLPLGKGHVALLLASGMLDGVVSTPDGCHVVRGTSTKEEFISDVKPIENKEGEYVGEKVTYSQRIVMTIRAVDQTGVIKTFSDSPGKEEPKTEPEERAGEVKVSAAHDKYDEDLARAALYKEVKAIAGPVADVPDPPKETGCKSWKVLCWTRGDTDGNANGVRFQMRNDADRYASDLFSRWTALERFEVVGCDDEPNR